MRQTADHYREDRVFLVIVYLKFIQKSNDKTAKLKQAQFFPLR